MTLIIKKLTVNITVNNTKNEKVSHDAIRKVIKQEILRHESLKKIKQFR